VISTAFISIFELTAPGRVSGEFFKHFKVPDVNRIVIRNVIPSATVWLIWIPKRPNTRERIRMAGINVRPWRESARIEAFKGFPIYWNIMLDITINEVSGSVAQ